MNKLYVLIAICLFATAFEAGAQVDRRDVRRGNRDFRKENYREADIDYRKALIKDSLSVAANYNLASTLYREGDYAQAQQSLERIRDVIPGTPSEADYYFNLGDAALQQKNYQAAVDAFRESLILRPEDLQAKENFIYAKKMLENQQNQQDQQNQNDQNNQDQNDQNQDDQNKDQNDDGNDQNQDDRKDDRNQPQNQPQNQQGQQPKITPQAAQQMLQAIQAKEKETQDKVNKKKAEALSTRQKEKNW